MSVLACDAPADDITTGFPGLAEALELAPGVAPRLSASRFRACTERVSTDGPIPRSHCPARESPRPDRFAEVAGRARLEPDNPVALQALGLIDLVTDDPRGQALERSIEFLRRAVERSARPASALADLSAALLVRAERNQAPRDLLEAHETAAEALQLEADHLPALFNRALALDRLQLVDETAGAWRIYAAADPTSGWGDEARRHLRELEAVEAPTPPAADAPPEAYRRYAAADPQGARELGMERLLAAWGEALQAGDAQKAETLLVRAAALGEALERRPGGDASLGDAVRSIRATDSEAARRALAGAHRDYGAGRRYFEGVDYPNAVLRFTAARAGATASPVLRDWTRVYLVSSQIAAGTHGETQPLSAAIAATSSRHPALSARARWSLGRTLAQNEELEPGLGELREASRLFALAGERENEGVVLGMIAELHHALGEPDSAHAALHTALEHLKPHRASNRLHNLMAAATDAAASDGFTRSAISLQGEGVRVAARTGNAVFTAEARLAHARQLAASGDFAAAAVDLQAARALVIAVEDESARPWLNADLGETEAVVLLRENPEAATRALDTAAEFFARRDNHFRQLPALVAAAEVRLAANDLPGALRRFDGVVRLLDRRRESIRMEPRRAAIFDAARDVVNHIVLLKLADGRAAEALDYMDRARASLATTGGAPSETDSGRVHTPPGETALSYARVADTLLVWVTAGERVVVWRTVVDTLRLTRSLGQLETRLQDQAPVAELQPTLAELYDLLIRPVEAWLGGRERPVVIVADDEIAAVPFAALYDRHRRRYLVEEHPLRFAVSLREARRRPTEQAADGILLVADPSFDRRQHPLEPLTHARNEVRTIAPGYPDAATLEGVQATRSAVLSALGRVGMMHFAGHAVFDDQRPERSYLVLAPGASETGGGKVTAEELARLDLRHVRLVVLSACRTVRSGGGRAGGFTGLAGALLAAGAGGAVGSTWEVDDRLTAALMTEFHRVHAGRGDGPGALRTAQLALLRSGDAGLRSPAAWAGFRYAGR